MKENEPKRKNDGERGSKRYKSQKKAEVIEQIKLEPQPAPEGPFRVIVLDPPWKYDNRAEDGTHRARNPYPDMTIEEIKKLPVASLAHDDCIVWLWTTNAFLHEAFHVLDSWGFTTKTVLTWVKDKIGLGDWLRGQTEHCLMAVRGKPTVTLSNQIDELLTLAPRIDPSDKMARGGVIFFPFLHMRRICPLDQITPRPFP